MNPRAWVILPVKAQPFSPDDPENENGTCEPEDHSENTEIVKDTQVIIVGMTETGEPGLD